MTERQEVYNVAVVKGRSGGPVAQAVGAAPGRVDSVRGEERRDARRYVVKRARTPKGDAVDRAGNGGGRKARVDKADIFASFWKELAPNGSPEPTREYKFCDERLWRFDFAWPAGDEAGVAGVAVEIDGGNWMVGTIKNGKNRGRIVPVGRHTQERDMDKCNRAVAMGWLVLHFSPQMVRRRPWAVVETVVDALGAAGILK